MKVLVSGALNSLTGYGLDTIELVQALVRWGCDVYVAPASVFPPLPRDVAAVLTKSVPSVVDLLISHKCPQELSRPDHCGLFSLATVNVAWSMWEWSSLAGVDALGPDNCEHSFRVTDHLRESLGRFDVVLAYDEVSRTALGSYHDNINVLQGGVDPLPASTRDWFGSPFRFLMCGVLSARKNPWAAISAFRALRQAGELTDATLTLKSSQQLMAPGAVAALMAATPGLEVISELWPVERLHALYRSSHVLLAPSWGEGKNRPAVEFATTGGAVVAPVIGGHAQWMSPEYAWPVDYVLKDYGAGAMGADVSVEHLADVMLGLYTDRAETARRAANAARCLPAMVCWDQVLERLALRLPQLVAGRGAEVSALMRSCRRAPASAAEQVGVVRSAFG